MRDNWAHTGILGYVRVTYCTRLTSFGWVGQKLSTFTRLDRYICPHQDTFILPRVDTCPWTLTLLNLNLRCQDCHNLCELLNYLILTYSAKGTLVAAF
jgi:hypothetical protein